MTEKSKKTKAKKVRPGLLKVGDPVVVISGGHGVKRPIKGKISKISAFVSDGQRVVLEGLNVFVKHQKALGPDKPAGKVRVERSMHISNVMYYVEALNTSVKLSRNLGRDGIRVRGYKDPKTKQFVELGN